MGDQQGIEFLHHTDGFLTAQRGVGTLVGLQFIGGEFPLPAAMIGDDEVVRGGMAGLSSEVMRRCSTA